MKILFVTPIFPFPVNSGVRQRMFSTLTVLAGIGDITLFSLRDGASREYDGAEEFCRTIYTVPATAATGQKPESRVRRVARNLLDPRPAYSRGLDSPQWHATFQSLHPETYDLVWVQTLGLYETVRRYKLRNVAVDLDGADSFKVRRELKEAALTPRIGFEWLEYMKLLRAETVPHSPSHRYVACSERDRNHFSQSGKQVWVVRNAVNIPPLQTFPAENDGSLLYVGTLGYRPNRQAVTHFVQSILPIIHQSHPEAAFHIVGSRPSPDVLDLARYPNVTISADVPSVEPYLRRAAVVVVPLLNGSGTRLKILEAMSWGKPVVSTSVGAEGLEVEHRKHLLIADTPEDFAAACLQLLHSGAARATLAANGRRFVTEKHSVQSAEDDISRFLEEAFHIPTPVSIPAGSNRI